jgi:hypothetical protein
LDEAAKGIQKNQITDRAVISELQSDYVLHCAGNLNEEKSRVNMFEFPTYIRILEGC